MADELNLPPSIVPPTPFGKVPRQPTFIPHERRPPGRPSYLQPDAEEKFMTALRAGNPSQTRPATPASGQTPLRAGSSGAADN